MIVEKKAGHTEKFVDKKAYKIFCRACLNAHLSEEKASVIATKALKDLKKFLGRKKKINSDEIFKQNIKILKKYNKEVAFLYETHRDIN